MLKFIGRHWRGEAGFWTSVLIFSLLVPWAVTFGGISLLSSYTIDQTPYRVMLSATLVLSLIGAIGLWQLVGTWRASSKKEAPGRWWITRWTGRLFAIAAFALALFALSTLPGNLSRYYAEATDTDPIGLQGHDVTVDGDQVIVTGYMSWGMFDAFSKALSENGDIQTVVLNSPGGHYAVGRRIGALIKERGLDTFTTEMCGSACTYAFLGGNRRFLQKGAKLGYHAPSGNTPVVLAAITAHATEFLNQANVPDDFISHIFATPSDSVWFPTLNELRQANIVTDVVK
jgi:hypothetical protein